MRKIRKLLIALRLLDADETLSLTSITLMVLIVKLAVAPQLDWTVLTAFFMSLLSYNAKKFSNHKKVEADRKHDSLTTDNHKRLETAEKDIKELRSAMSLKNLSR